MFCTCAPGLAPYLEQEIAALGYKITEQSPAGAGVRGNLDDAMRLSLHLRTAYAVMLRLAAFPCDGPDDLFQATLRLPWEEWLPPDGYFTVTSNVKHPTIDNQMYPSLVVKDAVADRMQRQCGHRPDSGPERNGAVLWLRWQGSRAEVWLNASGEKLTDRGYRKRPHTAPLRESLAAGILMAAGYDGERPLVNPMCGSGTLAIEGALLALNRAPGLLRGNFGFMHVTGFEKNKWEALRAQARRQTVKKTPAPVIASDHDPHAIVAARHNAQTAGVEHCIEFHVCDFAETPLPDPPGTLAVNPEYGVRLGHTDALREEYKRIGDFFKQQCSGWQCHIFTGNLELGKCVGLRTSKRTIFHNADLECRLLSYEIYDGSRKTRKQFTTEITEGTENEL
ncbi:class I SAM-dependent RNA methyltransferase [Candidatus Sumerlaeota bacterium]|nr:class I SAM-dependent RNA methyltransferase [Candidatus Sumerlaeota bacterium]